MTTKEKADELVEKFKKHIPHWDCYSDTDDSERQFERAKQCALIAVDEIIAELETLAKPEYTMFVTGGNGSDGYERIDFWQQVKAEVKNF